MFSFRSRCAAVRIGTDKLITKALHAVEDACWLAQQGPVDPSFALRFALVFLYANGDGRRECFDTFWKIVTDHPSQYRHGSESIQNTIRGSYANRELYDIYKAVGVHRSHEMVFHSALARGKAQKAKEGE